MAVTDWERVIDQAAELGVQMVQLIGGEPIQHPDLSRLINHALGCRIEVEVFSNLVRVTPQLWDTFSRPGVRLATSYYSDDPAQHDTITGRRGSHTRSTTNIAEAVRRSIPLRVGLIDVEDRQRVEQARHQLAALGILEIDTDRLRQVGRGVRDQRPGISQLCGGCADGKFAVSPTGDVWPCVFARWMPLGNVRSASLGEILTGAAVAAAQRDLAASRSLTAKCNPDRPKCGPDQPSKCSPDSRCDPSKSNCAPHCPPTYHSKPKRCWPYYYDEDHS